MKNNKIKAFKRHPFSSDKTKMKESPETGELTDILQKYRKPAGYYHKTYGLSIIKRSYGKIWFD